MLARGELQSIGATTTDEYRKYIEKDAALERRFQPIQVHEPTIAETIEILKEVTASIKKSGFDGIIVNISNPADVITHYIQHTLNWAPERIFSTSTTLDSARLRRAIAQEISARTGLPLEFSDERLSSSEAKRAMRAQGMSEREMRGKVDMIAASLFLQSWLDARK